MSQPDPQADPDPSSRLDRHPRPNPPPDPDANPKPDPDPDPNFLQNARRGRGPNLHLLEPGNTPEGSVSTGIGTDISLATDDSFPVRVPFPCVCHKRLLYSTFGD